MRDLIRNIRAAFHDPSTPIYRWVQGVVNLLIVASVLLFGVEVAYGLPEGGWLAELDQLFLIFFALEITLRVLTWRPPSLGFFDLNPSERLRANLIGRLHYCLEPMNLIDLVTVLALVPALRGLRALRLLRLIRTAQLFRYFDPFRGIARAFRDNRMLYIFSFGLVFFSVVIGGLSIFLIERNVNDNINRLQDGFWWAIVTLTTVGYGDISPTTGLGQLLAGALMIVGMFTLALFAGVVSHTLLNMVISFREEQHFMNTDMDHLVICGYDDGTRMLLRAILDEIDVNHQEVTIFAAGERPMDLPPEFRWVSGDPTKESELDKVRLSHAAAVIIVGARDNNPQVSDAITILTTFTVRRYMKRHPEAQKRRKPLYIVAEILDEENVEHTKTAGADEVIETTRLGFSMMTHAVVSHGSASVVSSLATAGLQNVYVGLIPEDIPLPSTFGVVAALVKADTGALVIGLRNPVSGKDHLNPADVVPVTVRTQLIYVAAEPALVSAS